MRRILVENLENYVRRGEVERAIKVLREEDDPIIRTELLCELFKLVPWGMDYNIVRDELLSARYLARDRKEKAIILSLIAEALFQRGEEGKAVKMFSEAMETAERIGLPSSRAEALSGVALNLLRAGFYEDAYDLFVKAVEALMSGETNTMPLLSKIADLITGGVEGIDDPEWAVAHLHLAAEVYEYVGRNLSSSISKRKAELIKRAIEGDVRILRRILAENRVDDAVLIARYLPKELRGMAFLEVSFWLYANGHSEAGRQVFEDAYSLLTAFPGVGEEELFSIAVDFVKLGYPQLASRLANLISSERLISGLLARIAVAYYRSGEEFLARTIAMGIPSETIKSRVLQEIGGEAHVGYEQGLQVAGGREKR
ncbi:tetratricopeptide repeat protein [Thermococcus sp.]|uniref:tetratricopeptide repeat protein n=1 Tax=Thermococcus sp. TaxID=35749 RepID=UPI002622E3EF|nr:tetratricopeptide repeat protein [Thermococcus sp.]